MDIRVTQVSRKSRGKAIKAPRARARGGRATAALVHPKPIIGSPSVMVFFFLAAARFPPVQNFITSVIIHVGTNGYHIPYTVLMMCTYICAYEEEPGSQAATDRSGPKIVAARLMNSY